MESRVSISLRRSTSETWSVCERASVRTMKSKSAAVNRARQFALIIGTSSCAIHARMASQTFLATDEQRFTQMNQEPRKGSSEIEGKAARVAAKKRGQRLSFNPGTQTEFTELTGLRR